MSLRDQIRTASAGLVRRETISLPDCGVTVQVKGLMAGEAQRAGEAKRQGETQVALSTEDPETGKLIWNPNVREDLDEIAGLSTYDFATIIEASNRLSGIEKLGKFTSPRNENGSSPSPEPSAAPSGS